MADTAPSSMTPQKGSSRHAKLQAPDAEGQASLQQALDLAEAELRECRLQLQVQGQYLNVLMHELKNPLSVIMIALESGAEKPEHWNLALRAVREMQTLLDRTLWMDQVQVGCAPVRPAPFDLADEIRAMVARWGATASPKIVSDLPPCLVCVSDSEMVMLIARNLIENAIKYADAQAAHPIRVSLSQDSVARKIVFSVENEAGPAGLPDPQRVFQKYYRAPGANHATGSGLGLHLSQALAIALGGELLMATNGNRVTFTLTLPWQEASR